MEKWGDFDLFVRAMRLYWKMKIAGMIIFNIDIGCWGGFDWLLHHNAFA